MLLRLGTYRVADVGNDGRTKQRCRNGGLLVRVYHEVEDLLDEEGHREARDSV